jgi:hypothetical protein
LAQVHLIRWRGIGVFQPAIAVSLPRGMDGRGWSLQFQGAHQGSVHHGLAHQVAPLACGAKPHRHRQQARQALQQTLVERIARQAHNPRLKAVVAEALAQLAQAHAAAETADFGALTGRLKAEVSRQAPVAAAHGWLGYRQPLPRQLGGAGELEHIEQVQITQQLGRDVGGGEVHGAAADPQSLRRAAAL